MNDRDGRVADGGKAVPTGRTKGQEMKMRKSVLAITFAAVLLGSLGTATAATETYLDVGVRFADGTVEKTIAVGGSATVEVFVQGRALNESPKNVSPDEVLAILSTSAAQGGAGEWITGVSGEPLTGWDYSNDVFAGMVETWMAWCSGNPPAAVTEHVVDEIVITHDGDSGHAGTWDIGLGTEEFEAGALADTIINITEDPEANTRLAAGFESVRLAVGVGTLSITDWEIAVTHGLVVGKVYSPIAEGYVESRTAGVAELRVTFDDALNPATAIPAEVAIVGVGNGDVSGQVAGVVLGAGDTQMTITLSPALPDDDTYTITIGTGVESAGGAPLSGDRDVCVLAVAGDANGTGTVDAVDYLAVNGHLGEEVGPANARFDVNASGTIDAVDYLAVNANMGGSAPACPLP